MAENSVPPATSEKARKLSTLRLVVGGLALLLLVVAIVQNTQVIVLRFLIWEFEVSQIVVIALAGLIGLLIGRLRRSR